MDFQVEDGQGAQALDVNQLIDQLNGRGIIAGGTVSEEPGAHMVGIEATAIYLNGERHETPEQTLDLEEYIENRPRKVIIYIGTDGEVAVAGGDPEDPRPEGEYRFNTFRPSPPDLRNMDAVPLAEVWLSPDDTETTDPDIRNRKVSADLSLHSASIKVLDVDTLVDGAGNEHTGELADLIDVPSEENVRNTVNSDPDHATEASHNYFSGDHSDLSNVRVDQHHRPPSPSEMRSAVRGAVDAADLDGASGATGQHLEYTGSDVRWRDPPQQQATVLDSGTVTHSGGGSTTVTLDALFSDPTTNFRVTVGVAEDPAWESDFSFSHEVSYQWNNSASELDAVLSFTWDIDPGSGNDLLIGYTIWDMMPAIVDGKFTDADALAAIDGAAITPAEVIVSSRLRNPVYDDLSNAPDPEIGDGVVVSGDESAAFGKYLYDGSSWSGPLGTSVTALSDLSINTAKSWNGYAIPGVGPPEADTDAARRQEIIDHAADNAAHHPPVTGGDIDHSNIQNVQPGQHHDPPTNQEIVEGAAGKVFSLPLFGATIPPGEYLRDYVYLESDETLHLVRGEYSDSNGNTPSGLVLQLYDQQSGSVEYRQNDKIRRSDQGSSLETISGRADVEVRIYNDTNSEVSASGLVAYHL